MAEQSADADLLQRFSAIERENRLLRISVKQLAKIRLQWTRSLDQLKHTKSELQVANRFLDRLVQTAPLPVLILTKSRGRVVMANAAAEALIGVGAGGLMGRYALAMLEAAVATSGALSRQE